MKKQEQVTKEIRDVLKVLEIDDVIEYTMVGDKMDFINKFGRKVIKNYEFFEIMEFHLISFMHHIYNTTGMTNENYFATGTTHIRDVLKALEIDDILEYRMIGWEWMFLDIKSKRGVGGHNFLDTIDMSFYDLMLKVSEIKKNQENKPKGENNERNK